MAPLSRGAVGSPWAGMRSVGVRAGVAALRRAVGAPEAGPRAADPTLVHAARAGASAGEQGFGAGLGTRRSAPVAAAVAGRGLEFGAGTRRAGLGGWASVRGFHSSGAMRAKKDPYSVLGVSKSASAKEIKKAYLMKVESEGARE